MTTAIDLDALILAGGESRRMGADKSLLPFGGQTLIEHVAAQLTPVAKVVRISTGGQAPHATMGLPLVADLRPGCGPLMGIASGLRVASRDWTLVVATDMPALPLHSIGTLWEYTGSARCVVPQTSEGRLQPLFALYHRDLADEILAFLDRGERRVLDFIGSCGATIRPVPEVKITNLNDRRAYENALAASPTPEPGGP